MPKVIFTERWLTSPNGYDLVTHEAGPESVEVSDECAEGALSAGAAHLADEGTPNKPQSRRNAKGKR